MVRPFVRASSQAAGGLFHSISRESWFYCVLMDASPRPRLSLLLPPKWLCSTPMLSLSCVRQRSTTKGQEASVSALLIVPAVYMLVPPAAEPPARQGRWRARNLFRLLGCLAALPAAGWQRCALHTPCLTCSRRSSQGAALRPEGLQLLNLGVRQRRGAPGERSAGWRPRCKYTQQPQTRCYKTSCRCPGSAWAACGTGWTAAITALRLDAADLSAALTALVPRCTATEPLPAWEALILSSYFERFDRSFRRHTEHGRGTRPKLQPAVTCNPLLHATCSLLSISSSLR